jgi:hypothetical protein
MIYVGSGGILPTSFNLVLDGGEWSASCPGHFTLGEQAPDTHWTGDLVGPRAGLNAMEKRKMSCPCWEPNPCIQSVACHYTN